MPRPKDPNSKASRVRKELKEHKSHYEAMTLVEAAKELSTKLDLTVTFKNVSQAKQYIKQELPETSIVRHCRRNNLIRTTPQHEAKFCDRLVKYIKHLLTIDFPRQCERARVLIFGTQTLISVTELNSLELNNYSVVDALRNYGESVKMIIGNKENPTKAAVKVDDFRAALFSHGNVEPIEVGPADSENLEKEVVNHFRDREDQRLLVVMMDSGKYKDYLETFRQLGNQYKEKLLIIKMVAAKYPAIEYRMLRAYCGELYVENKEGFKKIQKRCIEIGRIAAAEENLTKNLWWNIPPDGSLVEIVREGGK